MDSSVGKSEENYFNESIKYAREFKNSGLVSTFIEVQRLIWEKSLFPKRFFSCSVFMCSACNSKSRELSFCLKCGKTFCGSHFQDHSCQSWFGVDVATRQLFKYSSEIGRRFIFDSFFDHLIIASKLSVIDGVPLSIKLETTVPVFPSQKPPLPLQNLGNTCYINSLLQCFVVHPLLQKWFLSNYIDVDLKKIRHPGAAVHLHFNKLFLAQENEATFSISDFIFALWALLPKFATPDQFDAYDLMVALRNQLDDFYQSQFDISIFGKIFSWQFKIIESCENCGEIKIYLEKATDLVITDPKHGTLTESLKDFILNSIALDPDNGARPKCNKCHSPCKKQYFFYSLPLTLTIKLDRTQNIDTALIGLVDELSLDEYIDSDKQNELGEAKYSLIAVIGKPESSETGHFWSYVKRWEQWYMCDDDGVKPVETSNVLQDDAGLLFYVRKGIFS